MNYKITHRTVYSGSQQVSVCHNQSWLQPRVVAHQFCKSYSLKISPQPSIQTNWQDSFGNPVKFFSFNQGYKTLEVTAQSEITVNPRPELPKTSVPWETLRAQVAVDRTESGLNAYSCTFDSPRIRTNSEFTEYAKVSFRPGAGIVTAATELTQRIFTEFKFDNRATTVTTPVEEVFRTRSGVCQDFAQLQVAMLRSLRLPARYVSGYLRTNPPPGKPRLVGVDASHAWISIYCGPEIGWVDFDPTNNVSPKMDHITVAWGRDYSDVPPLRGVFIGGGSHSLSVSVDVAPLP